MHDNSDEFRRAVVLQTAAQARHYIENRRQKADIVIPIGPEAMYLAEKHGWDICNLGELWSPETYRQAHDESQSRVDGLIAALDAYSMRWNADLRMEIGRYYALQLWIIVGQIQYNAFIVRSIVQHLRPARVLVYTKDVGQPFLELRPDPDCIFADVLQRSDCYDTARIELQRISENRKSNTTREKIIKALPQTLAIRLREFRDKWRLRNRRKSTYKLLMIGGGYDWFRISRYSTFSEMFSLDMLPRLMARREANPPAELVKILDDSIAYAGKPVYDMKSIAAAIYADMVLYAKRHAKLKKKLKQYDAVVTAVLTYPWDNYLAHMAARMNIPVVVWQHGEKGQAHDVTAPYTELFYATDYLAYAPAVRKQYLSWIGKNMLVNVETVGSIGKNVAWRDGTTIVYATGKWFKTAVPFVPKPNPDERLFAAHRTILNYLDTVASEHPVIFKANNTPGLNAIPYEYANIHVEFASTFTALLETAGMIILDTPATTLVEACCTKVPIFVLGGRTEYHTNFLEMVKRRVVWCETPEELVVKIDSFLRDGAYEADVCNDTYLREYCAFTEPGDVVRRVKECLLYTIKSHSQARTSSLNSHL